MDYTCCVRRLALSFVVNLQGELYIIAAVALHLEVLSVHFAIAKYMSKVALTKINM